MDLTVGKVYLLRGGNLLRYQGPWGGKGPCLAFRCPQEGVSDPPVGYSASEGEVLREVTQADRGWLETRRDQARARNLHEAADDAEFVLRELG